MKLFVSDLDGTLLNETFRFSDANVQAIHKLAKHNIMFAVATGRIFYDAKTICHNQQIKPYVIANNGACIFDPEGNQVYGRWIQYSELKKLMVYLDELQVCYGICGGRKYVTSPDWEQIFDREISRLSDENIHIPGHKVTFAKYEMTAQNGFCNMDLPQALEDGNLIGYSISVVTYDEEKINRIVDFVSQFPSLTSTAAGSHSLEIMRRDGTKGNALRYLAGMLGLESSEIGAIGDSFNDITMLQYAGTSIAVGNAKQEVRNICTFTTESCADNGFAHAVDWLLQKR